MIDLSVIMSKSIFIPGGSDDKESACNAGDPDSIPGLGRSAGGGHGNPLQYSCLENPMKEKVWVVSQVLHRTEDPSLAF